MAREAGTKAGRKTERREGGTRSSIEENETTKRVTLVRCILIRTL